MLWARSASSESCCATLHRSSTSCWELHAGQSEGSRLRTSKPWCIMGKLWLDLQNNIERLFMTQGDLQSGLVFKVGCDVSKWCLIPSIVHSVIGTYLGCAPAGQTGSEVRGQMYLLARFCTSFLLKASLSTADRRSNSRVIWSCSLFSSITTTW